MCSGVRCCNRSCGARSTTSKTSSIFHFCGASNSRLCSSIRCCTRPNRSQCHLDCLFQELRVLVLVRRSVEPTVEWAQSRCARVSVVGPVSAETNSPSQRSLPKSEAQAPQQKCYTLLGNRNLKTKMFRLTNLNGFVQIQRHWHHKHNVSPTVQPLAERIFWKSSNILSEVCTGQSTITC